MRYEDASHTSAFQGQGPIANDDTDQLAAGSKSSATGNLITGDGTQTGSAGADSATGGHITAIAGKGGEDSSFAGGKLSVMGEYGKLSVDAQGNYVYQANKGVENVRDRFTYTLADNNGATDTASLVVEIGKTPFAVKADAQQVVVGPDGVVTLPAGVELSDVHVVGRNLVVDMPDGTQMIIIDGAVFVPQLVLNGVEVPATNVAALLIGQEVQPAAGETPPSSGGNFAVPPPPLDPGVPLGDLIPPTEYTYKPPEPQPPLDIQDSEPEAGVATALLDDDAQQGGNPLSTTGDDPGGAVATGNLPGSGGDGNLTWELTGGGTVPAGLGFALSPQLNGDLWILQGGVHVITVHVDPTNGDYIVTQIAAIDHTAGGNENNEIFTLNYSVTDEDGDVANGTLTIDVDDDMPTVNVSAGPDADVILTTDDAQTIGAASDTAVTSANFSGVFGATTVVFGADGAGPGSSSTYALAITGSNSGLASHGAAINLYVVGGVVVGSTAATAGAIDAGNTIFTVSTTNTGVVTLTQFQQIDHAPENPSGAPFNDQVASMADGLVTLTRSETAVDGDGDQVTGSASVNIGANLHFTDDGPTIGLADHGQPNLTVDETTLGTNDTQSFAANFSASFGADGPAASGSITYALGVSSPGVASGLVDTLSGDPIVLVLNNGVVEGHVGSAAGALAFTVSVNAAGDVTLDQIRAVVHTPDTGPDQSTTLAADNLVTLTATAHDFDGDTASTTINIGTNLNFEDDAPTAAAVTTGQSVSVDETAGVQVDSNDTTDAGVAALFAGVANKGVDPDMAPQFGANASAVVAATGSLFGADGAGTTAFSLDVSAPGVDSGLDTTDGHNILLFKEGDLVVGRVSGGADDGKAAFAIAIDQSGHVSMVEYLSIDHPNAANSDDSVSIANGAVQAVVTITDKDGDSDSASVNIGSQIQFQDDGPTVTPSGVEPQLTVDETVLTTNDTKSFGDVFDELFGADGPASSNSKTFALNINAGATGIFDTGTGLEVVLTVESGSVVGRAGAGGPIVFVISVNAAGDVTVDQQRAVIHPDPTNPDDSINIANDNLITLSATVTDGDGDTATATIGIGNNVHLEDDGPSANNDTDATDPVTNTAVGNVITGVGTTEGPANADQPHADGFGAISNLIGFSGSSDNNPAGGFDVNGQFGTLHMDVNGNYTYTRTDGLGGGQSEVFTYTYVDGDGDPATATLTINIADNAPSAGTVNIALDDDVIPGVGGNLDGVGDDDPDTVGQNSSGGTLPGSGGDGALTFGFGSNVAPAGFTYDTSVANTLLIKQGSTTVVTITINPATGAYTVTQNNPINHSAGGDENNQTFAIDYTVKDVDLDTAHGTININVDDDTPAQTAATVTAHVDEDELAGGNTDGDAQTTVASGSISSLASIGADKPGSFAFDASALGGLPALTSNGAAIHYAVVSGTLVAYTGANPAANQVFTVTLAANGNYTVTLLDQVDHLPNSPANNDNQTLTIDLSAAVVVTDADNDPIHLDAGSFNVEIEDDIPTQTAATVTAHVDEDELAGGNTDGDAQTTVASGSLSTLASVGADQPGSFAFDAAALGGLPALTSGGAAINYAVVAGTLIGYTGANPAANQVFTISLASNGNYTVTLLDQVDHLPNSPANNDNQNLTIDFSAAVQVTDADGDVIHLDAGSFNVEIEDDIPAQTAATVTAHVDEDELAGGNTDGDAQTTVASGSISTLASVGADQPGAFGFDASALGGLPALTSNGAAIHYAVVSGTLVAYTGANPAANQVFTVTLAANGNYTVTLLDQVDHLPNSPANNDNQNLTIDLSAAVQVTDADGDVIHLDAGSFNVEIEDDIPLAGIGTTGQAVKIDESVGIQADSNDTTNASVIALFAGVANKGTDTDLPQYAQNASAIVNSTGSSVGADAPGTTAFSLNVSSAGVDSGLDTTAGQSIFLFKEGSLIVGRVTDASGPAAFAIAIDPVTGVISMVEYLSINHPNAANADDSVSIANGAVLAVVTVTDTDNDTASQSVAIGNQLQFQDSGPVMTTAQNMNIQNSGDVAHTAAFAFNLGADGANTSNDVITNVTGSATVGGVAVQNWTLTAGAETATTASYSFSFDYPIGGGNTAHETGTLVFDKVAGTYTVDLANPIQGVTTILQTAQGTLFQGYEFGTSTLDGSQPEISVTQIQDLAGTANDIYVQFTSVAEPSSGTGNDALEVTNWVPGADNPPPIDSPPNPDASDFSWSAGQLFNQADSWVSTSNSANGVAGDTIQGGEVLDFTLVQGANPTGTLASPANYAQASAMFLKFDGIGSGEDMIVVLKLYDPNTNTYTTRAVMIENADIIKGPGAGPGQYSGVTLDNNDGLVIIESNDYNLPGENWVIVGAQVAGSDEGITGTAINLNGAIGAAGDSITGGAFDTQNFQTDTNDGPFKISSIGFLTTQTTPQNAHLDFNVTVTDGDGDSITQSVAVDVTSAADSVSAATIPAANTTVAPVVVDLNGDGVQFLGADAGVRYDYGHGAVATAWVGASDGILVRDADGNGTVDGAGEFVFGHDGLSDMQALAAQYGATLDANDADFGKFGVWQDANSNGVVDAGEFASLTARGITSISLTGDGQAYSAAGGDVQVAGSATYTRADGSTGVLADASFLTGSSVDEQRALNTSSSSLALAAAVAAAGLAASQPAAAQPDSNAGQGHEDATTAASAASVAPAASDDSADASRSALSNEAKEAANDETPSSSSSSSSDDGQSHHSLDDGQASAPASSSDAPANDDQGPAAATADATPVAPTVAMVSAEALQAAGLDGNVQHGGSVEKIIVEALGHGNGNGAVDALLDAFQGGNGGGAAIANLASAPSGAVSAWDMASNGASAGANEMLMKVGAEMLHHDAVQPTHNG